MAKKRAKREAEAKVFELQTLEVGYVNGSPIVSHDVDDLLELLPGMCNLIDAVLENGPSPKVSTLKRSLPRADCSRTCG